MPLQQNRHHQRGRRVRSASKTCSGVCDTPRASAGPSRARPAEPGPPGPARPARPGHILSRIDVDLRKLRYFEAVARHLHFGRAAAELHIAQPVLSRQIRALEHDLGVELFRRDRRTTELTEAGRQLLADAVPLLASATALRRRVARVARGPARLVVAFMPGLIVTPAIRRLRERHPEVAVEVLRTTWDDQVAVLHDGRADVSYLRLPASTEGLTVRELFRETRCAMLPVDHPLAGKEQVSIRDLAGEPLLQHPDAVPEWRAVATVAAATPFASVVEEKLEHVASGRGIVVLPLSTARFYSRPDVVPVPVSDLPENQVVIARLSERHEALPAEFAALA